MKITNEQLTELHALVRCQVESLYRQYPYPPVTTEDVKSAFESNENHYDINKLLIARTEVGDDAALDDLIEIEQNVISSIKDKFDDTITQSTLNAILSGDGNFVLLPDKKVQSTVITIKDGGDSDDEEKIVIYDSASNVLDELFAE